MANEMLADTTIAGQEGVIEYVANSAALQQFEQTSLAYLMLGRSEHALTTEGLCVAVEELLEKEFQVSCALLKYSFQGKTNEGSCFILGLNS